MGGHLHAYEFPAQDRPSCELEGAGGSSTSSPRSRGDPLPQGSVGGGSRPSGCSNSTAGASILLNTPAVMSEFGQSAQRASRFCGVVDARAVLMRVRLGKTAGRCGTTPSAVEHAVVSFADLCPQRDAASDLPDRSNRRARPRRCPRPRAFARSEVSISFVCASRASRSSSSRPVSSSLLAPTPLRVDVRGSLDGVGLLLLPPAAAKCLVDAD